MKKFSWTPIIFILPALLLVGAISYSFTGGRKSPKIIEISNNDEIEKKVIRVIQSRVSKVGPMDMKQPLPHRNLDYLDPFLLIHHHGPNTLGPNNAGLPFGPHPHKGFETVTFIYSGDVKHKDSNGFESVIAGGGIQYMTAAGGIVHSERSSEKFKKQGGTLEMIQIWINLPNKLKNEKSNYIGLQKSSVPSVEFVKNKVRAELVSGDWNGKNGPTQGLYPVHLATIYFEPLSDYTFRIPKGNSIMFYILDGDFIVNGNNAKGHQLVVFEDSGDLIKVNSKTKGRILLGYGKPIREPMVSYGPFVMTTEDEVMEAIEEYQAGKMGYLVE
jgi:quercetin 2,3-dioxygenase